MKNRFIYLVTLTVLFSLFISKQRLKAQVLDSENKLTLTLQDGTQVILYGKAISLSDRKSKDYYYLPTEPRLSKKKDGTPQFMFLKYMTDETEEQGGISGALLHMLMEWGLTPEQQVEVSQILKNGEQGARKGSVLKGAADVVPDGDQSFRIISAVLSDGTLAPKVITSSKAPTLPGSKIAVATKLNANGAQLLAATFEKGHSITDLSVELAFKYTVRMPAAKGYARIHWDKMKTQFEQDSASYSITTAKKSRGGIFGFVSDALFGKREVVTSRSYDEMHKFIETLVENEFITLKWEENMSDDRITKMREAFYEYFLEKMSNTADTDEVAPPTEKEKRDMPDIKYGRKYTFNRTFFKSNFKSGTKTFYFDAKLAVNKYFSVTGNLASWYDGVRDNKKCVSSVFLNDPFYQHRAINFVLDLDAEEIFEDEVNYVTVNVRKKRSSGNDFMKSLTIDRKYLKENGITGTINYARGEDKNSDVYEYKTQWSLRGGNLYPENPEYQKGDWEGVTLYPPITPRTIEFEADLDELSEMGFTRATLQLRYYKFGKEVETNIPMTVSKGEPLIEKTIFMDKDTQGYAYQLVLNNKDASKGKMAFGWDVKINDDYVYASIPEELKNEDTNFIDKAIEAGKAIVRPKKDGEVSKAVSVLDRFKDVLKVVKTE
jgi:hypothetical protein